MIVNTLVQGFIWRDYGAPDNDVHSLSNQYAQIADFYIREDDLTIFRCTQEGSNNQVWEVVVDEPEVDTMIVAAIVGIPQADWTQSVNTQPDYIKNKPAARSQSSATRTLNSGFQVSSGQEVLL